MIGLRANTRIWLAGGITDMRRGLGRLVTECGQYWSNSRIPGTYSCFGEGGRDLVKVFWFDGDGLCLFAKRLQRGLIQLRSLTA